MEREAMQLAVLTVALSRSDSSFLAGLAAGGEAPGPAAATAEEEEEVEQQEGEQQQGRQAEPTTASAESPSSASGIQVLLPALREDLRQLGSASSSTSPSALPEPSPSACPPNGNSDDDAAAAATAALFVSSRPYLTCCVRLSPEKEPHRFVELVEELARRGALDCITPLMVASSSDAYAEVCACV
jgi:hypothetical protein